MEEMNQNIADRWPLLYKWGGVSLGAAIAFLFAPKSNALFSISEVLLVLALLVACYKIGRVPLLPEKKIFLAFALYAGGMILSSFYQGDGKSIADSIHYVKTMLIFFLMYMGMRCFGSDDITYKSITIGSTICAGMLLLAYSDPHSMRSGRFDPWNNPNEAVQQLVMLVPFIVAAIYKLKGQILWRVLDVFSLLVIVTAACLTRSRGGLAGIIVGILVIGGLYWPIFKSKWSGRKKIILSVIMLFVASALVLAIAATAFSRNSSDLSRIHRMQVSYYIFLDNPVAGVGREKFNVEYQQRMQLIPEASEATKVDNHTHSHNEMLYFLATTGMLGTGGYMIFSLIMYYCLLKNIIRKKYVWIAWAMMPVMISLYVHGMVDMCILHRNLAKMFYGMLGLTIAIADMNQENG